MGSNSFRMSQYALLGSSLTPARVPIYSSSFVAPSSNTVAPRFGAEGTSTRYSPTYNGSYSRYQLQIDEPVVPNGDLIFPRHSKKNAVAYSGWMEKHSGIGNTWTRRWFVLEGGQLSYFYDRSDRVCKGVISLSQYSVHEGDQELERRNCLLLKPVFPTDVEYRLCCESSFSKRTWMAKMASNSHKGRIKVAVVGDDGCGKTRLIESFALNREQDCEIKASNPSVGTHVGYIPAPKALRKDVVLPTALGERVVSVETWESPGKGDFAHIRELLYNGIDVVIGVFSLADAGSLTWLERMLRNEVSKRVDGAPIILVGTKQDLRDSRQEVPAVGHSIPGSRGHLTPREVQDFTCVSELEGQEAAARIGASFYYETSGLKTGEHDSMFAEVALCGLSRFMK